MENILIRQLPERILPVEFSISTKAKAHSLTCINSTAHKDEVHQYQARGTKRIYISFLGLS